MNENIFKRHVKHVGDVVNALVLYGMDFYDAVQLVEAIPDAEPVTGEWVDSGERDKHGVPKPFAISCSICGSSAGTRWMKYCPNCGANMDLR